MTVAAKDGMVSGGGGEGKRAVVRGGNPWRRLWQVPLMVAGVVLFGLGVRALVRTIRPVPFADQVKGIRGMLEAEQFDKAIAQINIMGNYYKERGQQGELQVLAGDAHFLAQGKLPALVRVNYERVEEHYKKAEALGYAATVGMYERWGEAAMALGDPKTAVEKLEAAIGAAGGPGTEEDTVLVKRHGRELVAAYLDAGEREKALGMVDRILEVQKGAPADALETIEERTWGLCKRIEIALGAGNETAVTRAVEGARGALAELKERDPAGRILVWVGRAELERGDVPGAERELAEGRKHFAVHHLDDGRAAVMLAKIAEAHGDLEKAAGLFKEVAVGHAGTSVWAAARLGRAEVAAKMGSGANEEVEGDYRFAIGVVKNEGEKPAVGRKPEMISREGVMASLVQAYQRASDDGRLVDALAYLGLQKEMGDRETPEMAYRLASTRERRADEILKEGRKLEGEERVEAEKEGRAMYARAAEDYLRHAKLMTLTDEASGNSLWRAAELMDRAGETTRALALYERLTIQRPRDPRVPEGMLSLGRLLESAGMVEKAVEVYERNIKENAKTPAAYTSAVNLARCYMTAGEKAGKEEEKQAAFKKAEEALLSLVEEKSDLEPAAQEFRESLIALGELYYRSGRWSEAILRLDEVVKRYPSDAGLPRALFMLAETNRKSAMEIAKALKEDAGISGRNELEKSRVERLQEAARDFTRVIGLLDAQTQVGGDTPVTKVTTLDEAYLRSSYMDRAECYFERGDYEMAIKLYDQAASRFAEEATAVEAYVQIVNAYMALKQPAQAKAASERGRWILQRVPDAALGATVSGADRAHYEKLLSLGKM